MPLGPSRHLGWIRELPEALNSDFITLLIACK
jgi:hypothetical protein